MIVLTGREVLLSVEGLACKVEGIRLQRYGFVVMFQVGVIRSSER